MIKIHRRTPPVIVTCLGLFFAMGVPETSVAQALHRGAGEDRNRAAVGSSVAPGAKEGADLTLRLALFDTVGLDPAVTAKTKERVEETFRQIGVAIEWFVPASISDGTRADAGYYLKVILFAVEPVRWGHPADTMGIVIGTQFPHGAVWMFDPVIRRALAGARRRRRPLSFEELGRAYARVLAHEVVHALANDMRHTASGLMAPTQNRSVLISRSIEIDEHSAMAAVGGLRRCLELATTRWSWNASIRRAGLPSSDAGPLRTGTRPAGHLNAGDRVESVGREVDSSS